MRSNEPKIDRKGQFRVIGTSLCSGIVSEQKEVRGVRYF